MISKLKPHDGRRIFVVKCTQSICVLICAFCYFLTISGCNSSTEPKTATLTGQAMLVNDTGDPTLDPIDFSGLTVALYNLTILDTTLVRLNQEIPTIGVQINQETEFDHRLHNPIEVVTTDAGGQFVFEEVPLGTYNVVIFKLGWGFRYLYNVEVIEGVNVVKEQKGDDFIVGKLSHVVELFPIRYLPPVVEATIYLESDKVYQASTNTVILGDLVVETNATLLIDVEKRIDFYGSVTCPPGSGRWKISSSSGFNSTTAQRSIMPFDQVVIHTNSNLGIRRLTFERSMNGLKRVEGTLLMEESIIRYNDNYALSLFGEAADLEKNIISNNPHIAISSFNSINCQNSIVYNNGDACYLSETTASIESNYFVDNYIAIRPFYGATSIINNNFDRNDNAISPSASDPVISSNNFYDNARDIELNGYYTHVQNVYCNPDVESNNFYGDGWYVHLQGSNSVYASGSIHFVGVNANQIFPGNYLVAANLVEHIFDTNNPNWTSNPFSVSFVPRRTTPVPDAGIQ